MPPIHLEPIRPQAVIQFPPTRPQAPIPTLIGRLEGFGGVVATAPRQPVETVASGNLFDHPKIGGQLTICCWLHSDRLEIQRRCLQAIIATVPAARRSIRVGAIGPRSPQQSGLVESHRDQVESIQWFPYGTYKYQAMRQLFHNSPLLTQWVLWFDEDALAEKTAEWSRLFCSCVVGTDAQLIGPEHRWDLQDGQLRWMQTRPWYQNRHRHDRRILFPETNWFAASRKAILEADLPDPALENGLAADSVLAEQVFQAGLGFKNWNRSGQFINSLNKPIFKGKTPW